MVARVLVEKRQPENLYLDRLPAPTQKAFRLAASQELVSPDNWYLAGGTALALQAGHRESVDLDFFSESDFDEASLAQNLEKTVNWKTTLREQGTLYGEMLGAKMSFIAYPSFRPSLNHIRCGYIRMLIPEDIAAMKLIAISQRGRKRDFVDLYWHCQNRQPLVDVVKQALKQYPQEHNVPHLLKSLIYFTDARNEPMPKLHFEVDWRDITRFFEQETPKAAKHILGLIS